MLCQMEGAQERNETRLFESQDPHQFWADDEFISLA